jgi:hypothetical protein
MVGAIVLYDLVSTEGAFIKRSGINVSLCLISVILVAQMRQAINLMTKEYADQKPLINALRYSTLHFSDESTPGWVTQSLESIP